MRETKFERPCTMGGPTVRKRTGCGYLYITINGNEELSPAEVFAFLGKGGGCAYCQNDALAIAVTIGLRYGVPPEEYIKKLKEVKCPNPIVAPEEVLSCPDAMARALEEYIG